MYQYKCIRKWRFVNNTVESYTLINIQSGKTLYLSSAELKKGMKAGTLDVLNLQLTSNNRIIDKKEDNKVNAKTLSREEVERIIVKGKLMGRTQVIETSCLHYCYIYSFNEKNHILYIPDDVTEINSYKWSAVTQALNKLIGHLQVIGGENVRSYLRLFETCTFSSMDLTLLSTVKAKQLTKMFYCLEVENLVLTFDTSNVTNMNEMFAYSNIKELNISKLNTSKVTNITGMFEYCNIKKLILPKPMNTKYVRDAAEMFNRAQIPFVDLSGVVFQSMCNRTGIFRFSKIKHLIVDKREKELADYAKQCGRCGKIEIV